MASDAQKRLALARGIPGTYRPGRITFSGWKRPPSRFQFDRAADEERASFGSRAAQLAALKLGRNQDE